MESPPSNYISQIVFEWKYESLSRRNKMNFISLSEPQAIILCRVYLLEVKYTFLKTVYFWLKIII